MTAYFFEKCVTIFIIKWYFCINLLHHGGRITVLFWAKIIYKPYTSYIVPKCKLYSCHFSTKLLCVPQVFCHRVFLTKLFFLIFIYWYGTRQGTLRHADILQSSYKVKWRDQFPLNNKLHFDLARALVKTIPMPNYCYYIIKYNTSQQNIISDYCNRIISFVSIV